MKPHTFGALRMTFAMFQQDKKMFMNYLKKQGYTQEELEKIREAFLSIGTDKEVPGDRVF